MGNEVKAAYTDRQGQFLAFICTYTKLNGQPPADADMQRYFKTEASSIHQMVLTLADKGLIERTPGEPRSIKVLEPPPDILATPGSLLSMTGLAACTETCGPIWAGAIEDIGRSACPAILAAPASTDVRRELIVEVSTPVNTLGALGSCVFTSATFLHRISIAWGSGGGDEPSTGRQNPPLLAASNPGAGVK